MKYTNLASGIFLASVTMALFTLMRKQRKRFEFGWLDLVQAVSGIRHDAPELLGFATDRFASILELFPETVTIEQLGKVQVRVTCEETFFNITFRILFIDIERSNIQKENPECLGFETVAFFVLRFSHAQGHFACA